MTNRNCSQCNCNYPPCGNYPQNQSFMGLQSAATPQNQNSIGINIQQRTTTSRGITGINNSNQIGILNQQNTIGGRPIVLSQQIQNFRPVPLTAQPRNTSPLSR